jgi:hypothetical protein
MVVVIIPSQEGWGEYESYMRQISCGARMKVTAGY